MNLPGGRTPENRCRQRSSAATFVGHFTDFLPGSACGVRLKALAFEGCFPEPKRTSLFPVIDGSAKAFLNQGLDGGLLLVGNLASLFQKRRMVF